VSDRRHHITRRNLLRITGLAPLAALVPTASATAAPPVAEIHEQVMARLVELAQEYAKEKGEELPVELFKGVAADLWRHFGIGVSVWSGVSLPVKAPLGSPHSDVILAAYGIYKDDVNFPKKSGNLIVDRLWCWEDVRDVSNYCAAVCGDYAAERAKPHSAVVDVEAYRHGFKRTEQEMKHKMKRLKCMVNSQGREAEIRGGSC
jgi:hypothetical protein